MVAAVAAANGGSGGGKRWWWLVVTLAVTNLHLHLHLHHHKGTLFNMCTAIENWYGIPPHPPQYEGRKLRK